MKKDTPAADIFVPRRVLEEISRGSHEQVVESVREAVEAEEELFGESGAALVATFKGFAVVATPSGKFWRARYEVAPSGDAWIVESKPVSFPVVTKETAGSYVRGEARKLVDRFFSSGLTEDTRNHLHDVVTALNSGISVTPEGAAGLVVGRLVEERSWRGYVNTFDQNLREFTGIDPVKFEGKIKPRFSAILSGEYDSDKEGQYLGVVRGAVQEMIDHVGNIAAMTKSLLEGSYTLTKEWRGWRDADSMVAEFMEFVGDFADDVNGLKEDLDGYKDVMGEASLESIAAMYDEVAQRMREVELAGAIAEKFAKRFEAV